jgi:hypothetical protein
MITRLSSWRTLLALALAFGLVVVGLVTNLAGAGRPPAQPYLQPTPIPAGYTFGGQPVGGAGSASPDCGLCWYPFAPEQAQTITNLTDVTVHRCDATGGHCARMHVVVQTLNSQYLRTVAYTTCYSASGDFPCAHVAGNAWLNCTALGGVDCSTNGPAASCTGNCPLAFGLGTAWYRMPVASQQYSGAASIVFTTGAAGGGSNLGLAGTAEEFGF